MLIVPVKNTFPTPTASEIYKACISEGSRMGPKSSPNPIGPGWKPSRFAKKNKHPKAKHDINIKNIISNCVGADCS